MLGVSPQSETCADGLKVDPSEVLIQIRRVAFLGSHVWGQIQWYWR